MKINVFICIGLPGSGKSTWAKEKVKKSRDSQNRVIIVNKDQLRTMIHGTYVFHKQYEDLVKALRNSLLYTFICHGYDIIIDETNISREKRIELLYELRTIARRLDRVQLKITYVWFTENRRNLQFRMRNPKGQKKTTWESVINNMRKSFERPLKSERYDELIKIKDV